MKLLKLRLMVALIVLLLVFIGAGCTDEMIEDFTEELKKELRKDMEEAAEEQKQSISDQVNEGIDDLRDSISDVIGELNDSIRDIFPWLPGKTDSVAEPEPDSDPVSEINGEPDKTNGKILRAIEWAKNREDLENHYINECHRFVWEAYESAGINTENFRGCAISVYNRYPNDIKQGEPPVGAMVLYSIPPGLIGNENTIPHTALSLGEGKIIHNNTYAENSSIVEIKKYNEGILGVFDYLGWIMIYP